MSTIAQSRFYQNKIEDKFDLTLFTTECNNFNHYSVHIVP